MRRLLMPLLDVAIGAWLYFIYGWPGLVAALAILVVFSTVIALILTFRDRRRSDQRPPFGRQFATNLGRSVTELPFYFS